MQEALGPEQALVQEELSPCVGGARALVQDELCPCAGGGQTQVHVRTGGQQQQVSAADHQPQSHILQDLLKSKSVQVGHPKQSVVVGFVFQANNGFNNFGGKVFRQLLTSKLLAE